MKSNELKALVELAQPLVQEMKRRKAALDILRPLVGDDCWQYRCQVTADGEWDKVTEHAVAIKLGTDGPTILAFAGTNVGVHINPVNGKMSPAKQYGERQPGFYNWTWQENWR